MYTRTPETRVILCHARIVERVKNITQPIIRLLRVLKHKIENIATSYGQNAPNGCYNFWGLVMEMKFSIFLSALKRLIFYKISRSILILLN